MNFDIYFFIIIISWVSWKSYWSMCIITNEIIL